MAAAILPPGFVYYPADITAYDVVHPGYNGDPVPAYVARPSSPGAYPGLLLAHGVHGHEEHMKDVARRFAVLGYVCIVPALYSRDGFLTVVEEEDMAKAHDFLRKSSYVGDRVGLVGFCSGGRMALIYDCNSQGLSAFVNFYSNGIFAPTEVNPVPAGEMVKDLSCPMLGLFGDEDTNPSPDDVGRLRGDLETHGKTFEIVSYKNAAHAFFSDTRSSYRSEVCYMAWGRCLEWLSRYLKP